MRREVLYTLEGIYREDFKITGFTFGQGDRAACVVGSMRGNESVSYTHLTLPTIA